MNSKKLKTIFLNNAIVIMLILVSIVVGIIRPGFFSDANARNLIVNTAVRFIIALGVSGCLITKGTDLSAGRAVGLAACLGATFLQRADYTGRVYADMPEFSLILVLLGVILITTCFGMFNGLIISYLKVPPFITTLGTQTIIYGICLVFTGAQPIGGLRKDYTTLSTGAVGGIQWIPYLGVIALVLGIIMFFVYGHTRHGKNMYAIGGNENAAEVSGVNTTKTKILIYATAGALYGFAGFLLGAKAGGASVNIGFGYELEAIAGCTIGGVSTNGGVGRISGILVGVLVFELLKIAMQFVGVEPSYTYIVQGIVIIVAVALDIRKYVAKK